jgi:protein TonB
MFEQLLESRATRVRRRGGAALSVIAHATIIAAATAFTMRHPATTEPEVGPVIYVKSDLGWPRPQPAPPRRDGTTGASGGRPVTTFVTPELPVIQCDCASMVFSTALNLAPGRTEWCAEPADCRLSGPAPSGQPLGGASELVSSSELAARILGEPPRPRYPEMLRSAGVSGRVLVQFTVDTTGRVDLSTVRVVQSAHDLFSAAVLDVLPRYRFAPAEVNGRHVRMTAQMPFDFELERR